ncbi:MAG: chitobiase/beta-hexosaminidase C-terminal domain-containing protein [Spirochaetales bacterium]
MAVLGLTSCDPIVLKGAIAQRVSDYQASQLETVETPAASVEGTLADATSSTYSTDILISLATKTPDAQVHYTTDGSLPTESSPSTPNPVPLAGDGTTLTLKAIATKSGYQSSQVFSATYSLDYLLLSTPIFWPVPGDYSSDTLISLVSTSGSSIRYTSDGLSAPSPTFGNLYTGSFSLPANSTTTFQAVASQTGWRSSRVALGTYTSHQAGTPDTSYGASGDASGLSGSLVALAVQSTADIVAAGHMIWDRSSNGLYPRIIVTKSSPTGGGLATSYLRYRESQEDLTGGKHDMLTSDAFAVAVQTDNKFLVAGWEGTMNSADVGSQTSTTQVWTVLRFAADAMSLERKFDSFGAVDPSRATSLVVDSSARIVVAGVSNTYLTIARYSPDGTLDASFGSAGYTETAIIGTPVAVVLNADGSLTAVMTSTDTTNWFVDTVRFRSDGTLDTTYGNSGVASVSLPNFAGVKSGSASITAAAGQSDGKIVFVGTPTADSNKDHPQLVGRLTLSGTLDTNFGASGFAFGYTGQRLPLANPFPAGFNVTNNVQWDEPRSVAISTTGKILVAGTTRILSSGAASVLGTQLNLTRYTPSGNLDNSYNGVSGYVLRAGAGALDQWNAVCLQPNGEALVAGQRGYILAGSGYSVNYDLSISRFW